MTLKIKLAEETSEIPWGQIFSALASLKRSLDIAHDHSLEHMSFQKLLKVVPYSVDP